VLELGKNSHLPLALDQADRKLSGPFVVSLPTPAESRLSDAFWRALANIGSVFPGVVRSTLSAIGC
jgi:hypothetical protein